MNELFCTPCFVSVVMYIVYIRLSAGIYITCKRGLTQPTFGACTKISISFWQFYETVCFPKTADPSLVVNLFLAIYWNAIYFIVGQVHDFISSLKTFVRPYHPSIGKMEANKDGFTYRGLGDFVWKRWEDNFFGVLIWKSIFW